MRHSPFARAGDPSRAKLGMSLNPAAGSETLAYLGGTVASILVVNGDTGIGGDVGETNCTPVYEESEIVSSVMKRDGCTGTDHQGGRHKSCSCV